MEDISGKKFSLQDWVMKRAANQSGVVMPSQSARQYLAETAAEAEEEISQQQSEQQPERQIVQQVVQQQEQPEQEVEVSLEVEMRAVSNGSTISSPMSPSMQASKPSMAKDDKKVTEQPSSKKEESKDAVKDAALALGAAQNPLQQLQIVRLLTDLGDRLRQSEKEREILWKEVEICRKQIADMSGNAGKTEKSFTSLEAQINQREVFVKELVEKQIGLEQQLKDQMTAIDTSKQEQGKLQEKLNSVETAAGSAIVRVEDVVAENSKLAKKVEQLSQDKARLVRKLEVVEETLTQTQDILKAKALVLLTDHAVAAQTQLPQTPAWTGDDTLKVSQAVNAPKTAVSSNPAASIAASLQQPKKPNMMVLTVVTAMIAGIAAFGVIWMIKNHTTTDKTLSEKTNESIPSETKTSDKSSQQNELMAQAAKIANDIEPSSLSAEDEVLQPDENQSLADNAQLGNEAANAAQDKAIADFGAEAPTEPLESRIKPDKKLPSAIAAIEAQAFAGDAAAQHDIAAFYTAGRNGVKVDYAKAAKWFEESAHNGSANAQYNLGVLYHQGLGVPKDTAKAIELYRVAAANDHPEALYNLAIAYVEGVGVEYNPQIAAVYFEKSAEGGVQEAAYNLGLLQENGLLGESQPDEAVFWYKIAADNGNPEAVKALATLKKKLGMNNEDVIRVTQKIANSKPGFLNDAGKASLPSRPVEAPPVSMTEKAADVKSVAPAVKAEAVSPALPKADPVIVSQIQEQLIRLGFYKGVPNGTLSPSLVQAIKTYQTKNALKVDGKPSDDLLVQMLASVTEAKTSEVKSEPSKVTATTTNN